MRKISELEKKKESMRYFIKIMHIKERRNKLLLNKYNSNEYSFLHQKQI